jgi:tetratricopeptide (TPR) repeat protein
MGKLILCSGTRTNRPYGFSSNGMRIYSIEELCYYLFQHIYLIDEELFCDALIDWIQNELKLPERAEKLRQLKHLHADAKTLVTVVLCSADYYTEYEIKSYLKELDTIVGMPKIKRNCIKANNYLKQRQYKEAEAEYERLLEASEAAELTPEDYGDILHNLAIAKLHTIGYHSAAELFEQAYHRNHKDETLYQYLYSVRLIGNEELYYRKLDEYQISEELRLKIEDTVQVKKEEALQCGFMTEMKNLRQSKLQGHINEYYLRAEELIEGWKDRIRQI